MDAVVTHELHDELARWAARVPVLSGADLAAVAGTVTIHLPDLGRAERVTAGLLTLWTLAFDALVDDGELTGAVLDALTAWYSAIVDSVDIVDLYGDVRVDMSLDIESHDAELDLALIGAEEENPVEAATFLESYDVTIKGAAFIETIGSDVGLDSFDGHAQSLERWPDPRTTRKPSSRLLVYWQHDRSPARLGRGD